MTALRGFRRILPPLARTHRRIVGAAEAVADAHGFDPVELPCVERLALFARSLGDDADAVSKEMYRVVGSERDAPCLRPEGTASATQALVSSGLVHALPQRHFYCGPMFRYERPQRGRFRQFTQFGVEYYGAASPRADALVVEMGHAVLRRVGLAPPDVRLLINSIGDADDRARFRGVLREYLEAHRSALSADSVNRLDQDRVLRILDSKDPGDRDVLAGAPRITAHLSDRSRDRFESVLAELERQGIAFTLDPSLVRGLDYYSHTTFEFVSVAATGAQNALLAGGRYDGLVEMLGGPKGTPAVGWACGVDRVATTLEDLGRGDELSGPAAPRVLVADAPDPGSAEQDAQALLQACTDVRRALQAQGVAVVEFFDSKSLKKKLAKAAAQGVSHVVLVGPQSDGTVRVKHLATGTQSKMAVARVPEHIVATLA